MKMTQYERVMKATLADPGSIKMHTVGWANREYEEYLRSRLYGRTVKFSADLRNDVFSLAVLLGTLFSTRTLLPSNEYALTLLTLC